MALLSYLGATTRLLYRAFSPRPRVLCARSILFLKLYIRPCEICWHGAWRACLREVLETMSITNTHTDAGPHAFVCRLYSSPRRRHAVVATVRRARAPAHAHAHVTAGAKARARGRALAHVTIVVSVGISPVTAPRRGAWA